MLRDLGLDGGRDLGIGNDKRREDGVGLPAFAADNTHDTHTDGAGRSFQGAVIISMYGKACRAAAGTGELMKIQACGNGVINFLDFFRHGVEIWDKKGYHNSAGRHEPFRVWAGTRLCERGFPAFLYVTRIG